MAAFDNLAATLLLAVEEEASRLRDELIAKAVRDYEAELRARLANTSMRVAEHFDVCRRGYDLVVTIKGGVR